MGIRQGVIVVAMAAKSMIFGHQSPSYIDCHYLLFLTIIFDASLWNYIFSWVRDFTVVILLDGRCLGKKFFTKKYFFHVGINYKKLAPSKFDLFSYFVAKDLLIKLIPAIKNGTI